MQSMCSNADKEDVASEVVDDLEENFPGFDYFALVILSPMSITDFSFLVTDNDYEPQYWRGEGLMFDICNHQLFIWR